MPEGKPYGSLDAMLKAEIGETADSSVVKVQQRTAQEMAADETVKPLADHGEVGRGRDRVDNINSNPNGTSASYLVRRLKRDAPEVAESLARGEFKSARAAGIAVPEGDAAVGCGDGESIVILSRLIASSVVSGGGRMVNRYIITIDLALSLGYLHLVLLRSIVNRYIITIDNIIPGEDSITMSLNPSIVFASSQALPSRPCP